MSANQAYDLNEDETFGTPTLVRLAPVRPNHELDRPRLAVPNALRNGQLRLATLFAPAGYGKSTVMARWRDSLQQDEMICCWLGLRDKHRDAKTLLQALLGALRQHAPTLDLTRSERNLRSANSSIIEPVLACLMQEIEDSGLSITLFLDDSENLERSPGREAINLLIEHRPEHLSLVLAGRDCKQFSLARDRMAGQLIELKPADLSFTPAETKALLVDCLDLDVQPDALNTVVSKTEGWPVALGVYAMSANRGNTAALLETCSGTSEEISEYLGEIMLADASPETRDLLMRAALPEHFNIKLLQVLVPHMDAAEALQKIRDANPFLQTLNAQQPEYRFHSLCADFLRRQLFESKPALHAELLRAASDWCWSHDQRHEAIHHARAAGDWQLMADRLTELAEPMVRSTGEFDTFLGWLRDLPADVLKAHPQLFLHQAWALCFKREMPQAEIALTRLEALLPSMTESHADEFRRTIEVFRYMMTSVRDRGHSKLQDMQGWLERFPDAPEAELGIAHCCVASAARNANQPTLAITSLQEAERIFGEQGRNYSLSWVHNVRLSVLIKQGNFCDATVIGRQGLAAICETLGDQSPAAGMSNAMLAYLAYEKGDVSQARDRVEKSLRFIANQGVVDPLYYAHLTLSWLAADDNNEQLALDVLLEGEQIGIELDLPRLTLQLATRRTQRYLQIGDQAAADALIASRQLLDPVSDEFFDARTMSAELLRVNIDLQQGRFREAADRARNLSRSAHTAGNLRMKAEYDYLLAIAMHHSGDDNEAGRRLRKLLALAAVQQRFRFVLNYASLSRGLIADHYKTRHEAWETGVKPDAADGVLKTLVESLGLIGDEAQKPEAAPVEGLTKREADILRRAARTGLNNKKLAEALFVSEGTLKWHLHNIYSKLEVRNRAGAIAQAQRMGLINA